MHCKKREVELKKQKLINEIKNTLKIADNKKDIQTLNDHITELKNLKQDKYSEADVSIKICQIRKNVNDINENILRSKNINSSKNLIEEEKEFYKIEEERKFYKTLNEYKDNILKTISEVVKKNN